MWISGIKFCKEILSFKRKFTLKNLRTVQKYLNTLYKCGEMTALEKKEISPTFNRIDRIHGLPKIHISYETLPSF